MTESETDDLRQRRHLQILVAFSITIGVLLAILLLIVCVYLPWKDRREYTGLKEMIGRELPMRVGDDLYFLSIDPNGPDGINISGDYGFTSDYDATLTRKYLEHLALDNELQQAFRFMLMSSLPLWFDEAQKYDATITFNLSFPGVKTLSIPVTPRDYRDFKAGSKERKAQNDRHDKEATALLDSLVAYQKRHMTSDATSLGMPPMPKGVSLKDITVSETRLTYVFEIDEDVTTPIQCENGFHWSANALGEAYVEGDISKDDPLYIPIINSLDICFKAVGSRTGYTLEHTVLTSSEGERILKEDYLSD